MHTPFTRKIIEAEAKLEEAKTRLDLIKKKDVPLVHMWMVYQAEVDVAVAEHMVKWQTDRRSSWLHDMSEFFEKSQEDGKI